MPRPAQAVQPQELKSAHKGVRAANRFRHGGYPVAYEGGKRLMITIEAIPNIMGHNAYDESHRKVGKIGQVYVDEVTGQPEWMTVNTGLFGTRETFVPLEPAHVEGDEVVVPFGKDQIKDAPSVEPEVEGRLSDVDEMRLYEYYGLVPGRGGTTATGTEPATAVGRDTSGPTTDDAMTRSEERLRVGKETREVGRVHLRKYVVTETEQQTVPVRKERIRVEREPITEQNIDRAMAGPEISEEEHEVVLHEERPVAATETVPVERVRLSRDTAVEEETVTGQVRKERIETDGVEEDDRL
jgi:uncharacterized protein (TIGR02271 family)